MANCQEIDVFARENLDIAGVDLPSARTYAAGLCVMGCRENDLHNSWARNEAVEISYLT